MIQKHLTNKTKIHFISFSGKALLQQKRVSGRILKVLFDKRTTTFNLSDFVKQSKKLRSNVIEAQVRDIFQYEYCGICLSQQKQTFIIRNIFNKIPFELTANLLAPSIESISIVETIIKISKLFRAKYYYLRHKPLPQSATSFGFVIDMYDHDIFISQEN